MSGLKNKLVVVLFSVLILIASGCVDNYGNQSPKESESVELIYSIDGLKTK